jgi:MFS family permease
MPLSIFKSRNRSGSYVIMLCLGVAVFGMFFFLTQYLQNVKGYSAVRTGLAFLPMSIGIMVAAMTTARFVGRTGIRLPLITGPMTGLAGMIWLTQLTPTTPYLEVIGPLLLIALGMGQCFVPLTLATVGGVAPSEAGLASALLNAGQQVGGALGLAVLTTIAISSARSYIHANASTEVGHSLINAATVHGYTAAFSVAAGVIGFALLISLVVLRVPRTNSEVVPDGREALAMG